MKEGGAVYPTAQIVATTQYIEQTYLLDEEQEEIHKIKWVRAFGNKRTKRKVPAELRIDDMRIGFCIQVQPALNRGISSSEMIKDVSGFVCFF